MKMINDLTINPSASVLDLGCGDGLITSKLAEAAPNGRVVGTDISEAMIAFAAKTFHVKINQPSLHNKPQKNPDTS